MSLPDDSQLTVSHHSADQPEMASYLKGFGLSIALTLAAYIAVTHHSSRSNILAGLIIALALVQFVVQMVFFLHLGRETKPRWKLMVFAFMLGVVGILVGGSLWIMANLNYHHGHMSPGQTDKSIIKDEGIKP